MTTRQQVLRSSTPGQTPAAGTRQPGELWITFPDRQLGYIDASRNAQPVVAVRFFSTLANYVAGDFVIQAGGLYAAKGAVAAGAFNPSQWTKVAAATDAGGPYLPIAGGTLTGALVLAADPGAALGAATKQYVDGKVTAAPFLPIAGGTLTGPVTLSGPPTIPLHAATKAYVDAGAFVPIAGGTMTGDLVLNRDPVVALGAATKQSVDARGAGDNRIVNGNFAVNQRGQVSGTALATTVYGHDRWKAGASGCTYTFPATLPDTTITITAGTLTQIIEAGMIEGGVYVLSWTGTAQARVYQGSPSGSYVASPVVTASLPAGVNTVVEFNTGTVGKVKLEIGSVATPYNRQSLAKSLADCARYFLVVKQVVVGGGAYTTSVSAWVPLSIAMRAAPTAAFANLTNSNTGGMHLDSAFSSVANISTTTTAAGIFYSQGDVSLNAEL